MSKVTIYEEYLGKVIKSIEQVSPQDLYFDFVDGSVLRMAHSQECCEIVELEDIAGDLKDLLNQPLLMFEEVTNSQELNPSESNRYTDSQTWTFYKLATINGSVTLRWFGGSNGWYSERVDLEYFPNGYPFKRKSSYYN